jgi:cell division protein FtsW
VPSTSTKSESASAPAPVLDEQAPVLELPDRGIDLWLLGAVLALLAIGVVEVFSSSAVYALKKHGESSYFLQRQLAFLALGAGAMVVAIRADYRWLRRWTYPVLFFSIALLALVLTAGATVNGARRWFVLGPLSLQPVEIAKLALIAFLAYSLSKKARRIRSFTVGFVPHCLIAAIMMGLAILQPDLGSAVVLGATTLGLLFVAGSRLYWLVMSVLASAPIAYHFVVGTPWRLRRLMAYFNPEAYATQDAYQIVQAGISIGSGGLTGAGIGQGRQQLGYMPEGHSDFILAGIGEEMGFLGIAALVILFGIIVWRGALAAARARDSFGCYLAFGITLSMAIQALFNAGVALGLVPAKGITLPLVSYGGSSLIVSMFAIGLLLSVARAAPPKPAKRVLVNRVGARRRKRRAEIVCA